MTVRAITRILITGGSAGIGLAAAMRLSRRPAVSLVINGRNAARGEAAHTRLREAAPQAAASFVAADVSEAGIAMFSRTLAREAKRRRMRANVVTPSLVRGTQTYERVTAGGFSAKLFEKATRAAHLSPPEADEVAAVIEVLADPDAARATGQVISVNGGISAG
jgi:2-hydroxycyclohexanecarboxyl-CoA dehydrogenase